MNKGLFKVLKKDLVKDLEESQNVKLNQSKQPKVDTYGAMKAEIKYQIYFTFDAKGKTYV